MYKYYVFFMNSKQKQWIPMILRTFPQTKIYTHDSNITYNYTHTGQWIMSTSIIFVYLSFYTFFLQQYSSLYIIIITYNIQCMSYIVYETRCYFLYVKCVLVLSLPLLLFLPKIKSKHLTPFDDNILIIIIIQLLY